MNAVTSKKHSKTHAANRAIEEISLRSRNHLLKNERAHTRYFRQDIGVEIRPRRLFERKYFRARLVDITPRGASILASRTMQENNRLQLKFSFDDGATFVFRARVVRRVRRSGQPSIYGIEFDDRDPGFKDKLLMTQLKLNMGTADPGTSGSADGE